MVVTLETNQDLFEHQLELEADMLTGGVNRFRKARDKAIEKGRESHLPHGRAIVGTVVGQVAQGIEQYLANPSNPSRDIA